MNKPFSESDFATPKVTTGPIAGSRKAYTAPEGAPDLRVPRREIVLAEAAGEPPVPVYDPSGPYTEGDAAIEVEKGLKRARVEWVRERGGIEEYQGRPIKPLDVDLRWVGGVMYRNAEIEETGVAAGVLGHPALGVAWLANKLGAHGVTLEAGHIVLAGSFTRVVFARKGDTLHADFGNLGGIAVRFV